MAPLSTYIAANVRRLRVRLGLTQAQLAEQAGFNGRHLQRIERGVVDMRVESLGKLAQILGVTPGALLRPARLEPSTPGRPRLTGRRRSTAGKR
jgi:transcriptional regulator with XRE-family HTH domain